jgi:tRNA pseudouridine13 synthase
MNDMTPSSELPDEPALPQEEPEVAPADVADVTVNQPYLTADLPGIGGRIKDDVANFVVDEIPLYPVSGEGTHLYFRVTKRGIPTPAAIDRLARHMNVPPIEIGFAGLKDAQALTSQCMSLEHADAEQLARYRDPQVKIEVLGLHGNKLRAGHLLGNRFVIRIRGVGAAQLPQARRILDVLLARGVPNFFGQQRFGARGDTAKLGELMVRNDAAEFIATFLGRSRPTDPPDCKAARDAFDAGFFDRARDRWPWHYVNERKALAAYKRKKHAGPAIGAIDKRMKRLYVSAFQSEIYNEVLARRLQTIDHVFVGDLAQKTDSGGVFMVEDAAVEQPRAERFEISPTGPVVGYRSNLAQGREGEPLNPGEVEQQVLAAHHITLEDFRHVGALKIKGTRRPLRFRIDQATLADGSDPRGEYLELAFVAPSGCYATVVLSEMMK